MSQNTMVIGLTGQSGAGKSTLSRMFADRGVPVIDADVIARETMEHSSECRMDLVLEFSTEVIHPDASLNREKLAEICFSDKAKLKRLNEITYPYIIAAIVRKIEEVTAAGAPMLLLDAPTLYESGLDRKCDRVVAVIADRDTRVARIIARDGITEQAALLRINAQQRDSFYTARANDILTNDKGTDALSLAFLELYARLERLAAGEPEPLDLDVQSEPEDAAGDFAELEEMQPSDEQEN